MSKSNSLMSGKKRRQDEDEMYFDNYHTHKRYLTEVMASSMIGLSVSDSVLRNKGPSSPVSDRVLSSAETPCTLSRSASSFPSQGDETSTLDSLMSEDSDDSIGYRFSRGAEAAPQYPSPVPCDFVSSHLLNNPRSHSPRRLQKLQCSSSAQPVSASALTWVSSSSRTPVTPTWRRFSETEGRLPPSPNDPCQGSDLRRATLLRNLSMKTHLPAQPICSDVPDMNTNKTIHSNDCLENVDQRSPNGVSGTFQEHVGCNTSALTGSPLHGPSPSHAARGSSRVRSLVLGESTIGSSSETSTSIDKGDETMTKLNKSTRRLEEKSSHCKRSRSPRSPRSPSGVGSSNFEISSSLSPMDGNISDTESSLGRTSTRTCLCAR